MANPTITVEVKEVGTDKAKANVRSATDEFEKLNRATKRQETDLRKLRTEFERLQAAGRTAGVQGGQFGTAAASLNRLEKATRGAGLSQTEFARRAIAARRTLVALENKIQSTATKTEKMAQATRKAAAAKRQAQRNGLSFANTLRDVGSSATLALGPLSGVGSRIIAFSAIATRARRPILGLTAAILTAGAVLAGVFAVKSIRRVGELEAEILTLNAAIKATGREAETSSSELDKIARALGRDTLTSAQEARQALAVLTTFTNIQSQNLERSVQAAQDLNAVFGGGLVQNARRIGLLLDDPITGMQQLRRQGINFSEALKQSVRELLAVNRRAEAVELIFDRLNQAVGGAGITQARGLKGLVDTLGESVTRLLEAVGVGSPLDLAKDIVKGLTDAVDSLTNAILKLSQVSFREFITGAKEAEEAIKAETPSSDEPGFFTRLFNRLSRRDQPSVISREGGRSVFERLRPIEDELLGPEDFDPLSQRQFEQKLERSIKESAKKTQARISGMLAAVKKRKITIEDFVETPVPESFLREGLELGERQFLKFKKAVEQTGDSLDILRLKTAGLASGDAAAAEAVLKFARANDLARIGIDRTGKIVEFTNPGLRKLFENFKNLERAKEAAALIRSLESATEKFARTQARLNTLFDEGRISFEQYVRLLNKAKLELPEVQEALKLTEGFLNTFFDSLVDNIKTAESFGEALKNIFTDIIDFIIKEVIRLGVIKPILEALFPESQQGGGSLNILGALVGAVGAAFGGAGTTGLPQGFASGGMFKVGGVGGTDSQFRGIIASPNETVTVERPEQLRARQGGSAFGDVFIDATGADPAALRRVESNLRALARSVNNRSVSAVVDARRRQPKLFTAGS